MSEIDLGGKRRSGPAGKERPAMALRGEVALPAGLKERARYYARPKRPNRAAARASRLRPFVLLILLP